MNGQIHETDFFLLISLPNNDSTHIHHLQHIILFLNYETIIFSRKYSDKKLREITVSNKHPSR